MTLLTFFPLAPDGTEAVSVIRFRHPACNPQACFRTPFLERAVFD